jgi:hypothetical protein
MNPLTALLIQPALAIASSVDPVPEPEDVTPGWGAAILVVGLIVATVLLWFSLRKQLGRIRFREEPDASDDSGSAERAPRDAGQQNGSGAV